MFFIICYLAFLLTEMVKLWMHIIIYAFSCLENDRREEEIGNEMEQESEWKAKGDQGNIHRKHGEPCKDDTESTCYEGNNG